MFRQKVQKKVTKRAVEVGLKNLVLKGFFTYCVSNLIKVIFKYELRFVEFTRPTLCSLDLSLFFIVLVGHNFVSGICNLNLKTYFKKPLKTIFLFLKSCPALTKTRRCFGAEK